MHLHSVLLTESTTDFTDTLPYQIEENIRSFQQEHPHFKHRLYSNESLREFIKESFGRDVLCAYDELVPLAYKADLGRYCLLYIYGGIYSDISNFFFSPVTSALELTDLYIFRDNHNLAPWIVSNSIIASPARAKIFANCIDRICEHTKMNYYGFTALCPTGPNLFGTEIAKSAPLSTIRNGKVIQISDTGYPAYGFISANGGLVAIRRKKSAGIASLGINPVITYEELYRSKEIYKSNKNKPKIFLAEEYFQKRFLNNATSMEQNLALLSGSGENTPVMWGPFFPASKGNYLATFFFQKAGEYTGVIDVAIDMLCNCGKTSVFRPIYLKLDLSKDQPLKFKFGLNYDCSDLEIRLFLRNGMKVYFSKLELEKIN